MCREERSGGKVGKKEKDERSVVNQRAPLGNGFSGKGCDMMCSGYYVREEKNHGKGRRER